MERNARIAALTYGAVCYALFFATFLYLIAFVADVAAPKTIETGAATDVGRAFLVDSLLLVLFGLQHSVMARPRFKAWWTRYRAARDRAQHLRAGLSSLVLIVSDGVLAADRRRGLARARARSVAVSLRRAVLRWASGRCSTRPS